MSLMSHVKINIFFTLLYLFLGQEAALVDADEISNPNGHDN
jgi:hypothetical protein